MTGLAAYVFKGLVQLQKQFLRFDPGHVIIGQGNVAEQTVFVKLLFGFFKCL